MADEVQTNFGVVWPAYVGSLTQFLIDCRRTFDGDLDLFLVLAIIGDRSFSSRHAPGDVAFAEWQESRVALAPNEDINVQCIADYSGIPRETVRRKLKDLMERGWVDRDENGFCFATLKSKDDLEPLTLTSLRYIERMFKLFQDVAN